MVKIIFGTPRSVVEDHAKVLVKKAQDRNESPIGVAEYLARAMAVCDDCGESYWHRGDLYYSAHVGCKYGKNGAGF